jgi:hypothetical protein
MPRASAIAPQATNGVRSIPQVFQATNSTGNTGIDNRMLLEVERSSCCWTQLQSEKRTTLYKTFQTEMGPVPVKLHRGDVRLGVLLQPVGGQTFWLPFLQFSSYFGDPKLYVKLLETS